MPTPTPSEKFKILIVDDDEDLRSLMVRTVSSLGYDVDQAPDGLAAQKKYTADRFALIISDIVMPGMNGVELLQHVKKMQPEIDVVLITGNTAEYTFSDIIDLGASDFLKKPFTKNILTAKINRILRERALINELQNKTDQLRILSDQLEDKVAERTAALSAAGKEKERVVSELAAIFYSNTDGIITVDPQMRVIRKNNVNMRYIHIEEGRPFTPHHNHLQNECFTILQSTLANRKGVKDYRIEMDSDGGGHVALLVNSALLVDRDKQSWGALLNLHDITKIAALEEELSERRNLRKMVGGSESMRAIYKLIRQVANAPTTILITGETGTGKELIADAIHAGSQLKSQPLIKVNCAALPENLLESELFGHVKGAFTDAISDRVGSIQEAEGGVLFLDEIGEIPPKVQLRLLRFIENKEYQKVGSSKTMRANVRVLTATNANLENLVEQGKFRADLYFRLRVMCMNIPPLRDRLVDIPLLTAHFVNKFNYDFAKNIKGVSPEVQKLFNNYAWPGNVRELKHAIEHAFLLCEEVTISPGHLPSFLAADEIPPPSFTTSVRKITRDALLAALHNTDWNMAKTARGLHISRGTLYNKIKRFQISRQPR